MTFFKNYYFNILKYDLINKFQCNAVNKIPSLNKIVLTLSFKNFNIKNVIFSLLILEIIVGYKAFIVKNKKPKISLKLKKGMLLSSCKIVFRNKNINLFCIKFIYKILPYLNQPLFILSYKNINYISLSFNKSFFFEEFSTFYKYFKEVSNLNISFIFDSNSNTKLKFLLQAYKINLKTK